MIVKWDIIVQNDTQDASRRYGRASYLTAKVYNFGDTLLPSGWYMDNSKLLPGHRQKKTDHGSCCDPIRISFVFRELFFHRHCREKYSGTQQYHQQINDPVLHKYGWSHFRVAFQFHFDDPGRLFPQQFRPPGR